MKNRDIVQAFANGDRSGEGSHMFIDGRVLYSYGTHFPLAFRADDGMVYYNGQRYSSSTSKHQSYVRNILNGAIEVNTEIIKQLIDEDVKPLQFKTIHHQKSVKVITDELTSAGFTTASGQWDDTLYGELPINIKWRRWYERIPNMAEFDVGVSIAISSHEGKWIGILAGSKGILVKKHLDIANAVLA
jgi:hypothetical protein